jgi:peptidoglycan hydrolase-like protein with peptidoglycan-binding domain
MPSTSTLFPSAAHGVARRQPRSSLLRIVAATVRAGSLPTSLRGLARPGLATGALAAVLMLCLAGTSLGAGGNQGQAQRGETSQAIRPSSGLLGPGAGYAVHGGSRLVRALQRRLRRGGYTTGPVDGLYGPRTTGAVRRFQQANGLKPDGVVGPQTRAAVRSSSRGDDSLRPGAGSGDPGGSQRVREVQRMLRSLGYDTGPVDGVFGPRTQAAVQWFQVKRGDRPSGVVDPQSLTRLRGAIRGRPLPSDSASLRELAASPLPSAGWHGRPIRNPLGDGKAEALAPANRPRPVHPLRLGAGYRIPDGSQRVRRIQRMLRRLGYESGVVDGRFGPRTKASVQWFQMKHGFEPSGVMEPATLTHLRALARAEATVQRPRERVKATPPTSHGKPAPPGGERATHDGGAPLLVLALLGALGATAVLLLSIAARRRRPRDPTTGAAKGQQPRPGGKPSRDGAQRTPRPDPSPAVATATATAPARSAQTSNGTTPAPTPRRLGRPPSPPVIGYATGHDRGDLERQAAAIERACRERGWTLALVVRDHGSHECEALVRPGLAHALEQLRGGSAARLVVDRLERLGSSVADLRPLLQWCARNEVDLVALDGRTDASAQEAHVASGVGNGDAAARSGNGHTDAAKAGAKRSNGSERTDGART